MKAIVDAFGLLDSSRLPDLDNVIVHGGARGADEIAGRVAESFGLRTEVYPAKWNLYGKGAGPMRNQQMVDKGADLVLAFLMPGSKGTADCINRAKEAGLKVIIYNG